MTTVGSKIDHLHVLREKRRQLEKEIEHINKEFSVIEADLLRQMQAEGLEKAGGKFASAAIVDSVKPTVEDWDLFYNYIKKNDYFHLLERRPSVTGCRELFETKGKIPGVVPFTIQKVSLRNN
jgi:hypothetical protein